ncbi:DUF1905 domain-containing protein [Candidatus Saccharibacteria bacterium]|nr:DUF1905 domain-containing protein [Candidatus Saccharibacteria bacterium]MCB9821095.1 DUF1905 domain-containing protein [Candidatus Nomurabacteria bacterium]
MTYDFKAKLWKWQGDSAWHFMSLPRDYYPEIKLFASGYARGFGSVKVEAKIGNSIWKTSIFPDSKTETFMLPINKQIREQQKLIEGESYDVELHLIDT